MKIATQHYQDSVITPYGNNHWNGKEKIDISKEKDDALISRITASSFSLEISIFSFPF